MSHPSLVLVASGSSGAIILPSYLSELKALPYEVTVVMTETAQRFVSPEVVGWFADRVVTPETVGVNPVELGVHADAVVVLPATGNLLATVALGLMPTPASTLIAVAGACLLFPHLHARAWQRPVMQSHVEALRAEGHVVVAPEPAPGFEISSGRTSIGLAMPCPDRAAELVAAWLEGRRPTPGDTDAPAALVPERG